MNSTDKAGAVQPEQGRIRARILPRNFDLGWVVVGLLVLIAASPLLEKGLPNVADAPIHLFRTAEWVRSWQAGILVPRWSPTLAYGYGYPLFVFAPPLPYAIAGGLHLAGLSLVTSIKLLSITCLLLAGGGSYLLARSYLGSAAGVVAAAAYLFAPFVLREAYIYGGNYPQLLAICLFPSVLWAFHRLLESGRTRFFLLATFLYGALMLSHNFHALVFTPVLGLFVLGEAGLIQPRRFWQRPFWTRLLRGGLAWLLGLGWTAYFWLPALVERQLTRAQENIYVAVSPFRLRFLGLWDLIAPPAPLDSSAANPAMPFSLGPVLLVLAALGLLTALIRKGKRWPALLFVASLAGAVLMMLPASEWLWSNVPLLAVAEFPWRLMGLAVLACSFLAGLSYCLWPEGVWNQFVPALLVLAILLGSAVYLYPPKDFVTYGPSGTPSLADQARYERDTGTIGSTTLGEYLSLWVKEVPGTSPLARDMIAGRPIEKLDRDSLPQGAEAKQLDSSPNLDTSAFASQVPFTASFHTFYFPGWQASIDGQPAEVGISEPYGLIEVDLPAGEHELTLRFGETPLRKAANGVSLLSLLAIAALAVANTRQKWEETAAREEGMSLTRPQFTVLAVALLVLLLAKTLIVDGQTTWFRRQSPPGEVIGVENPVQADLEGQVRLLGYDLDRDPVKAGQRVRLTLYWQALAPLDKDYNVFAHLDAPPHGTTFLAADTDPPGDAQAQIDIPTTHWDPGSYIRDEHRFVIPEGMAPVRYTLRVGLYDPATDEGLGEAIALQEFQVLPSTPLRQSQVPGEARYELGDHIELLGYELGAGEAPNLTLYWHAWQAVDQDYVVFVHIVDADGQLVDQRDGSPLDGMYPTSKWAPGQIITERRELPDLPPGGKILVGLYDLETGQRLPAVDEAGNRLPNDAILLP